MSLSEALAVLGVEPGMRMDAVRVSYRRQVRRVHPDLVDLVDRADAGRRTAAVTDAFAVVRDAVRASGGEVVPAPSPVDCTGDTTSDEAHRAPWTVDTVEAEAVDSDTISIAAPAPEAFSLLLDAAASIGAVGYVDRHLGILEIMVRFEGGPTCSLLVTLQGRSHATEAFCTMDSIEATATPPLRPVVEALVDALRLPR